MELILAVALVMGGVALFSYLSERRAIRNTLRQRGF
jgi:hypothetical protein